MALKSEDAEIERLIDEVARLTGEGKTEAVRKALQERRARLRLRRIRRFLEEEAWPKIPAHQRGRRLRREEEEEILGYGPDGV